MRYDAISMQQAESACGLIYSISL